MTQQIMYPAQANSPATELTAAITDVATTVSVLDASKLPDAPNIATIGVDESAETIKYTGKSGNTLTGVARGFNGTVAKAWAVGNGVARYFTAYDADAMRTNIEGHSAQLADIVINVKSFGASGDGVTDDTLPIQTAIDSLIEGQTLLIPKGIYNTSDLIVNTRGVIIDCRGVLNYIGTGSCLTISEYFITLKTPNLRRTYTGTGIAKNDLLYTGVEIRHGKNFTIETPNVEGFRNAILLRDDTVNLGAAYGNISNVFLANNLIGYKCLIDNVGGWTNETKMFGGRIALVGDYSDYSESAYFDLLGDNHKFYGVCAEGVKVERKIKGNFRDSEWTGCRFEGSNGVLDIEITGNGNRLIGNRDYENIILNTGTRNVITTSWKTETGISTGYIPKILTATTAAHDYTVTVESCYYLINATQNAASITFPQASASTIRYVPITIKKLDYTSNQVSIGVQNGKGDYALRTFKLTRQGESVTLMSDGSKWEILNNYVLGESSATGGFDNRTFPAGIEIKNDAIGLTATYASKICVQTGTNGGGTITATGTAGQNTIIASGDTTRLEVGQFITIATAGDFIITGVSGTTISLNGNLSVSVTSQSVTFTAPVFRKKDAIRIEMASAPTSGTWVKGDIVWNSSPSAGGYAAWICITAGAPGVWKTVMPIAA
ncbi:glycosyl hydrolase family 28-related protein [Paenibacillus nitricinens]|uniref:glycosyl hydrolase family 28-related protein n=1 Tax=Paenibacillus nitricinens TaxID=3367691 RepID=UPI003F864120